MMNDASECRSDESTTTTLIVTGRNYEDFLKGCCDSAENKHGVLVISTPSDASTDTIISDDDNIDNNSSNDENIERSCSGSGAEHRQLYEKLAGARDSLKDPFPLLSPMPLKSLQPSSNRLNVQNVARHEKYVIQDSTPSHAALNASMKSIKTNESRNPDTSATSPSTLRTPPRNRDNNSLATPSSLRTDCNSLQKLWMDPFPTPDVSRCGTPCSVRVKADCDDSPTQGNNINARWETAGLFDIPKLPVSVEMNDSSEERPRHRCVASISSPQLHSSEAAEIFPVRKVSSLPMMNTPSLKDIWGALQSGPDGNELVMECKEGRKKNARRDSEKAMIHVGELGDSPSRGWGQNKNLQRSSTTKVDKTPRKDLRSPLFPTPDGGWSCSSNVKRNENKKNYGSFTVTNATGAELAKEIKKLLIVQREGTSKEGLPTRPNRLSFRAWKKIKASRAVVNAGELVFSPVRSVRNTGQRAAKLVRNTRQKLEERKELRRQRRLARMKEAPRSWWIVIPADHPYKIAWDVLTMLWALLGAHRTHVRIRDRVFDQSPLIILTEVWFTVDILLNFVTEHKTRKGEVIRDGKAVWARYLTTWFIIDILSLIPWERVYVRPIVERIKKRNIFQKTFFRSKAVVRVSRVLRGRHVKLFGKVSKQTGTPLRRMVALVIKYLPKYLVFLRNMKGALVVRALRFVHWFHNMYKKIWVKARNAARHRMVHPIFGLIGPCENDSDSDSSSDDEDSGNGDVDEDSDSLNEDDGSVVLVDDQDNSNRHITTFQTTAIQGSPFPTIRRSFSQNELWRRD